LEVPHVAVRDPGEFLMNTNVILILAIADRLIAQLKDLLRGERIVAGAADALAGGDLVLKLELPRR
jgi:hypothetical protein